ncbi:MAG: T9SS type A sorting domain-containing protein [Chitinophagaceae bacterium]|nr:T9SS type A sorting domain-containing protein [Chitinophagaceae bacterium]
MKTYFYPLSKSFLKAFLLLICSIGVLEILHAQPTASNPATASMAVSVGLPCGGGTSTWSAHVFQYNNLTTTLSNYEDCKPSLAWPGFSIYGAGISFNPSDHQLYYYRYTGGNTYVWRWIPGSGCPPTTALYTAYNNVAILGFAFAPDGLCYQLIFTGSSPYGLAIRTVDFSTGTFGPTKAIVLPGGVNITQQSGDLTLTPDGKMLMVWDKKYLSVNYQDYATPNPLQATLIANLSGGQIVGLNFAEGKLIAADDSNKYWDLNILTGAKTAITQSPCYQSNDLTEVISGLGVAKKLSSATPTGTPGTYDLSYDITVKNVGSWDISNVQVIELLRASNNNAGNPFLSGGGGNTISNLSVSWVYNPLGLTLASDYTGLTTAKSNLLTAGQTLPNYPLANNYFIIRVSFRVNNITVGKVYNNNARVTGTGYAGIDLEDVSTDGNNPDLNNNSKPDDPGEDHPTPFVIATVAEMPPCEALEKILFLQNFGTGSGLSTSIPAATGSAGTATTDYTGSTSQPVDVEKYTLTNNANNGNTSRWISLTDHTTGSGRMMVVNADVRSNRVYKDQVNVSCSNLKYSLFAFVSNIGNSTYSTFCDAFGGLIKPKLIFTVRDAATNNIITNITTPEITSSAWTQYGMKFVMPSGITSIIIEITNAAPGGCGNDLAIDDIQFGLCDPTPTVSVNNTAGCTNGTTTFSAALSDPTVISGTVYYQWQRSNNSSGPWTDIASATSSAYTINPLTASDIGKYYRVLVGPDSAGAYLDRDCAYTSDPFLLSAKTSSVAPTSITRSPATGSICPGNAITLTRNGGSAGTNAVWMWYTGSCGGTAIGTGNSIVVYPTATTTYYVRAEGDCNITTCASITLTVTTCSVLPVDFLQFNAVQQSDAVDLNWKILTSEQIGYFDVEKSTDSKNFTAIGRINPETAFIGTQSFKYRDADIETGNNILYYRIKVSSKDGALKYSAVLSVRLSGINNNKIKISPNPAVSSLTMSFYTALRGNVEYQLIDMTGKVIIRGQRMVESGQNSIEIDQLGRYSAGVYTVLIHIGDRWERERIVIRK